MLLGTYPAKIVAGHRLAVPSALRKNLGQRFILARWYEGCLVLIDIDSWLKIYNRLTGNVDQMVLTVRDTERFILASAFEVGTDDQGRIVIPDRLVTYSDLSDEVYFIGLGDRVEIWNKAAWDEKEKEVISKAADYIEELSKK